MLELYTHLMSPCAQKVRMVFTEKGLQFGWTALYEKDCPRVSRWYARCRDRASYASAVAEDFPVDLVADLQARGQVAWEKIEAHLD